MSRSEHTPGPWRAVFFKANEMWDVDAPRVGEVDRYSVVDFLGESDAHLIAAAPDLLAALEHVVGLVSARSKSIGDDREWEAAREAIKKARGGA